MRAEDTLNGSPFSDQSSGLARVKIIGNLGQTSGGGRIKEENAEVPSKLSDIVSSLEKKYGLVLRRDSTLILVNGVEARVLDDLDTWIKPGDEIAFIPMFHGG
jgi:molybdopterin converting factor small subunit